ncbi:MAG TPA: acyl-CoA dehydrogenase family protein [Streptosporangiaceae bacterium]
MERPAAVTDPGPVPDLLYSEQETDLRKAVRALLNERLSPTSLLARLESGDRYDLSLWRALAAEVGCAGLLIPESLGGAGASFREAAVVAEETGRAVAPVPYLGSAVVAATALVTATGTEPAADADRKLIGSLADGAVTAALAVPFETPPGGGGQSHVRVTGPPAGGHDDGQDGGRPDAALTGTVPRLADALPADVLLVPADGVPFGLYLVDAHAAGVTRSPVVSLDGTRVLCDLTLDGVPARRLAAGDAAAAAVDAALSAGAAVLAAELLGVAQQCLDMTVAYAKERRQFARQIGSFQAIKHRLADLYVAVTQARAASRYAAGCLAEGSADAAVAVAMAKAYCGEAAVRAAEECVQLHGGIGFTWEHPAHLYLKRAKSGSIAFGTPDRHRSTLAALVGLPGPS